MPSDQPPCQALAASGGMIMSNARQMNGERIAGIAGAMTFLCVACLQMAPAAAHWDCQSTAFFLFHGEVAFFLLIRTAALSMRADARTWLICGVSLCDTALVDFSAPTSSSADTLANTMTLAGCFICIFSVACLGRGFGILPAWRRLADRGPYRVIRHPIYAGYVLMDLAMLCSHPTWNNWVVISCDIGLLLARIQLEEQICLQAEGYRRYARRVRYRLCPGIY